ncbi:MAG: lipoyl(octanoyl) transferase LipB [Bdellovibrionaceae bacterium]|nr:lipoyl(octanoyl) transferase LipB [Pseudobdellovibrionaceae bacterium]
MEFRWLGLLPYAEADKLQRELQDLIARGRQEVILGLEHPTVLTLGVRGGEKKEIGFAPIEIVKTDRGGMATLHNPGQLVIYPLVNIRARKMRLKDWICILTSTTQACLAKKGIQTYCRGDLPGLFTEKGKIMSLGLRINAGVSRHGIAINVNNDLSPFALFSPCGVRGQNMDRTAEYEPGLTTQNLFSAWCQEFSEKLHVSHRITNCELSPSSRIF